MLFLLLLAVACLADEPPTNCFSHVDELSWHRILHFDPALATISVRINQTGPAVLTCLHSQREPIAYQMELIRRSQANKSSIGSVRTAVEDLVDAAVTPTFQYIVFRGMYRLRLAVCDAWNCSEATEVESKPLRVNETIVEDRCLFEESNSVESLELTEAAISPVSVNHMKITFSFRYVPCTPVYPYERATVRLFATATNSSICDDVIVNGSQPLLNAEVFVQRDNDTDDAVIDYETPELAGDEFYCVVVDLHHALCAEDSAPSICKMRSPTLYISSLPYIASVIPYCTSHFRCGWLYVSVVGGLILVLSCLCAVICVHCCCRKKKNPYEVDTIETVPFEGLCLNDVNITQKRTWVDLHSEWDREPPKNPGKILLLYSPDTKVFKDLQGAFKSFLELACHCVVLDLFDEELFQSIAFDPELWLTNLLQDPDFKCIVICSQGAYKRQKALLSGEVLNIPDNSTLDGLFSAGLRFIHDHHAYDYSRLALARYEMLHLTDPEFRLEDMVPNREFLVPTQLHDVFCWIHGYDPLDLIGKPWDRYHLELQLLQDALKRARMNKPLLDHV